MMKVNPQRFALLVSIVAVSGPTVTTVLAQERIYKAYGDPEWDGFGGRIERFADWDQDGIDDLLVSAVDATCGAADEVGAVRIVSGRDGSELVEVCDPLSTLWFGVQIGVLDDVDADGMPEFWAAAPFREEGGSSRGRVTVYSGSSATELFHMVGRADGTALGRIGVSVGDQDGDGYRDLALANRRRDRVFVYSGFDGQIIRRLRPALDNASFPTQIGDAGDTDGDGVSDVLAASAGQSLVWLFSGFDGSILREIAPPAPTNAKFGAYLGGVGDIDQDGFSDYGVASSHDFGGQTPGVLRIYSGLTGSVIHEWTDPTLRSTRIHFGTPFRGLGDTNGDGVPDVLVGFGNDPRGGNNGAMNLYSGRTGLRLYRFSGQNTEEKLYRAAVRINDLDGDGIEDVVIGALGDPDSLRGSVVALRLGRLYADAHDKWPTFFSGPVEFRVAEGPPGNFAALFLTAFDGTPMFVPLAIGVFDATERLRREFSFPNIGPHTVELRGVGVDASGELVVTGVDTVYLTKQ